MSHIETLNIGEGEFVTCERTSHASNIKTLTPYKFMIGSSQITSIGKHGMFGISTNVESIRTSNILIVFYFKTLQVRCMRGTFVCNEVDVPTLVAYLN